MFLFPIFNTEQGEITLKAIRKKESCLCSTENPSPALPHWQIPSRSPMPAISPTSTWKEPCLPGTKRAPRASYLGAPTQAAVPLPHGLRLRSGSRHSWLPLLYNLCSRNYSTVKTRDRVPGPLGSCDRRKTGDEHRQQKAGGELAPSLLL